MLPIIIDTDPGKDDLFAILYLILSGKFDVKAVTTVAGNSTIQNVTNNAGYILDLVKSKTPIYSGASRPLSSPSKYGQVMGSSGLDGISLSQKIKLNGLAVEKIIEIVVRNPNKITILAIGPLTNIALAFQKEPDLPNLIKQLVIMGGAINPPGNTSRTTEFNIGFDPEAAQIVFDSCVPKVLIPLDLCYQTPIKLSDFESIKKSIYYPIFINLLLPYQQMLTKDEGQTDIILYDLLAAYYLTNPEAFIVKPLNIKIETEGKFTRGMSVADLRLPAKSQPNTTVAVNLNKKKFLKDFFTIINNQPIKTSIN